MTVYLTKNGCLRIDNVMMDGRNYDFIRLPKEKLCYRESRHLGGTFAPITDSPRYKTTVRKVVRQVAAAFDSFKTAENV